MDPLKRCDQLSAHWTRSCAREAHYGGPRGSYCDGCLAAGWSKSTQGGGGERGEGRRGERGECAEALDPRPPAARPTPYTPAPPDDTLAQATGSAGPTPTRDPANPGHAGNPRRHPGAGNRGHWPHPDRGPRRPRRRRPGQTTPGRRHPKALAPPQPGTPPTTYTPATPNGPRAQAT